MHHDLNEQEHHQQFHSLDTKLSIRLTHSPLTHQHQGIEGEKSWGRLGRVGKGRRYLRIVPGIEVIAYFVITNCVHHRHPIPLLVPWVCSLGSAMLAVNLPSFLVNVAVSALSGARRPIRPIRIDTALSSGLDVRFESTNEWGGERRVGCVRNRK